MYSLPRFPDISIASFRCRRLVVEADEILRIIVALRSQSLYFMHPVSLFQRRFRKGIVCDSSLFLCHFSDLVLHLGA